MKETFTAEQVLTMLMSQQFVDWYENQFMDFVEEGEVEKEQEILKDLSYYLKGR